MPNNNLSKENFFLRFEIYLRLFKRRTKNYIALKMMIYYFQFISYK
jgi:hypothetical protein